MTVVARVLFVTLVLAACVEPSANNSLYGCGGIPSRSSLADAGADADSGVDQCPLDDDKTDPGVCGCGAPETDSDGDSVPDCVDINDVIDDSFGNGGQFVLPSALGNNDPSDAATMPDGSIFVTGSLSNGTDSDVILIKLTSDGALDTSFNGTGFLVKANIAGGSSGNDQGWSVMLAPDGDLLVGGKAYNGTGNGQGFLWKVSSNGQDDRSFGNSGVFLLDPVYVFAQPAPISAAYDPATGNVFIVGESGGISAWRVLADGSGLDPSFGVAGFVNLHATAIHPSLGVDASGNLFVEASGPTGAGVKRDALSWFLDNNGRVVSSYGNPLIHADLAGPGEDFWQAIIPYGSDKVLLAGTSESDNSGDEIIARVNRADGTFDTSFGNGKGYWTEDVRGLGALGRVWDAVIESDGSITAALQMFSSDSSDISVGVVKVHANGTRDMTFAGGTGLFVVPGNFPHLITQPSGRKLLLTTQVDADRVETAVWAIN